METPSFPRAIFGQDFQNVYEPSEDTFLLLDALEIDITKLKSNTRICIECGSGSGAVITALSNAFGQGINGKDRGLKPQSDDEPPSPYCLMIATDINPEACRTTKKCAHHHDQKHVQIIRTNLAESLVDRLGNAVDLLVFNPPYVPTDTNEQVEEASKRLQMAWAGGSQGRDLTDLFLQSYVPRLLSKPHGVAYVVALDKNNITEMLDVLTKEHMIKGTIAMERRAGLEHLYVLKYEWIS